MHLSKSDFKACFDCRTKLYYRKNRYPSAADDNEYLQFLADGGFMVELAAKSAYPAGVDLVDVRDPAQSHAKTAELLATDGATIFEAGVVTGKYHVRIDILRRQGKTLELIEVKSSGVADDGEDDAASPFLNRDKVTIAARWKKYIVDVAFQAHVLQLAYPDFQVKPFLCVVNKSASVPEAATLGKFKLSKDANKPKARPEVSYIGDAAALARSGFMVTRAVAVEVALVRDEVVRRAEELAALIVDGKVIKAPEAISDLFPICRKCDYRTDGEKSGFAECWGDLAVVSAHVLDLAQVTRLNPSPVPALLRSGRASFLDLAEAQLGKEDSALTTRRRLQWNGTRSGSETLPPALRKELSNHHGAPGWPLHFVDFEACDLALPHHPGLRPFERVAFQWSCHTLSADGTLTHAEWLNDRPEFPNFAFARSLRERIGDVGTVYVWHSYEQTTLRKIAEQIDTWLARDPASAVKVSGYGSEAELRDLATWIWTLLGPEDSRGKRTSPRIRDLHKLAAEHYFHPTMGGRTSIKVVLPSAWSSNAALRSHPSFARYLTTDDRGHPRDPYKALPSLPFNDDDEEDNAVREGTGAIRTYQDLIFAGADGATQDARRQLLLQYCRLDTAAMVIIWAHWSGRNDFKGGE